MAAGLRRYATEDIEGACLAGTVGTDDAEDLTCVDQ
jgi:hypothetical protein